MSTRSVHLKVVLTLIAGAAVFMSTPARPDVQDRSWDPVVLTGELVPELQGVDPGRIVAFRYEGEWLQIPVQVDERAVVDFGTIYGLDPTGYTVLTYTDTSTFTGPDPDPALDADDEIVFMAEHAGDVSTAPEEPEGTLAGSGMHLTITDPLTGGTAHVYLFETDGSLDPGAGAHPVSYTFDLLSGDYKTTYNVLSGPNPENTVLTTAYYGVHFADRWIRDETRVTDSDASGADILDRHKALFAPGNCARSEDTFSEGEGAFIVNREGPVRALRGYVGANSGPTTYRIHRFYERLEEVITGLRVHPIPGIMDFFDYSPEASGMIFRNDRNTEGVVIDGVADAVSPGEFVWEMVSGPQGTLAMTLKLVTDIPDFDYSSYYLDDVTPNDEQCTGDEFAYGSSGLWEEDEIPNTDPAVSEIYFIFEGTRTIAYGPPGQDASFALARAEEALHPLTVTSEPYDPGTVAVLEPEDPERRDALRVSFGPNPVGESVRVRLQLSAGGPFSVRLFHPTGRLASVVIDGNWAAGAYEIPFDTRQLPPGVYLAVAEGSDGRRQVSRIVLLR